MFASDIELEVVQFVVTTDFDLLETAKIRCL